MVRQIAIREATSICRHTRDAATGYCLLWLDGMHEASTEVEYTLNFCISYPPQTPRNRALYWGSHFMCRDTPQFIQLLIIYARYLSGCRSTLREYEHPAIYSTTFYNPATTFAYGETCIRRWPYPCYKTYSVRMTSASTGCRHNCRPYVKRNELAIKQYHKTTC